MVVPYWIQDAIFYQIFPDRFANGDRHNDPVNVQPWGSPPTSWNFMGGDLRGIIKRFDYLLDLGVNAIYLNPIFHSTSNHRYNALDYFRIDPKLGDMSDFHALLKVAHDNHVHVILDGAFNHCGRGFFAFVDVLENQENSPYRDWFHIKQFPVNAYGPGESQEYLGWWGFRSMPKFNVRNPDVRHYLLSVARFWIEQGADGWRLDVPNEIDDDSFWAEFRETVKSVNRDAYLLGEIWTADSHWVGNEHFDGLMNYPLRDAILEFIDTGFLNAKEFAEKVEGLLKLYPRENAYAMYLPLGSHDTERLFTVFDGLIDKVKLAYTFLFSYPGAPAIYYGDECGLTGGKDPECRAAFPWDESTWNIELRAWVQSLIQERKRRLVLRRGNYKRVLVDERRGIYAFCRMLGFEKILVVLNASPVRRQVKVPVVELGWNDGQILHNVLGRDEFIVTGENLMINIPAWGGLWIG